MAHGLLYPPVMNRHSTAFGRNTLCISVTLAALVAACSAPGIGPSPDTDAGAPDAQTPSDPDAGSTPAPDAGGPPPACPVTFENASCERCFATMCASQCSTCAGDSACNAALVCMANCGADTTCSDACVSGLSTSTTSLLASILGESGCVAEECRSACGGGLGDPCNTNADCAYGACSGAGGWCTTTCTENVQCASTSASIFDRDGQYVWCVYSTSDTYSCFPGCTSNADCAAYPGSTCRAATAINGASTAICSF